MKDPGHWCLFASYDTLLEVVGRVVSLKDSAPGRRIPFTMQFRTAYPEVFMILAQVDARQGYQLERFASTFDGRGQGRWVYKFPDYPRLKADALARAAYYLSNGPHGEAWGEVIMVEEWSGEGLLATRWSPKDFLAPWT